MITFFTILFILIGINAILMFFSLNGGNQKSVKQAGKAAETSSGEVYPLNLVSTKYKKAI